MADFETPLTGNQDRDARSRNWVYTFNNYDEGDCEKLDDWTAPVWHVYGREVAPTTGTPHLQGAFIFANAQRWSSLMAKFNFSYLAPMKGSPQQNRDYCCKSQSFFEWGTCPKPKGKAGGEANAEKWKATKELAMAGKLDDVDPQHYVQFYGNLVKIKASKQVRPVALEGGVCGIWYYGATGVGKSRAARDENPDHYLKGPTKWFDGFDNQAAVIIEDIDPTHGYLGYHLKIWADRYPFAAEVKGSSICIRPQKIVVTSNYHPRDIWTDVSMLDPILRRFKIVKFETFLGGGGALRSDRNSDEVRHAYVPGFIPPGSNNNPYTPAVPIIIEGNDDDPLNDSVFDFEM